MTHYSTDGKLLGELKKAAQQTMTEAQVREQRISHLMSGLNDRNDLTSAEV